MNSRDSFYFLEHTPDYIHVSFDSERPVLASTVLGGGFGLARHILNLRVSGKEHNESPASTLKKYCAKKNWSGKCVGMMTAASMKSFRKCAIRVQQLEVVVMLTSGLTNARRAGDPADYRRIPAGTINIIFLTNARLTPAAMVETIMTITEAKCAVLSELKIKSTLTGKIATGTGTDAIAVVSGYGSTEVSYAGKHVLFGEITAKAVMQALKESLAWYKDEVLSVQY